MARESLVSKRQRALGVAQKLESLYPGGNCLLSFRDPFTLTIAVLLSAQTTDAAVNKVTPILFDRWPDPPAMAGAKPADLAEVIKSIGLYKNKAANCIKTAQMVISDFDGEIPASMAELTRLPGVGRKTANIVLNNAFGIVEGIAVDTHVFRIAHRLRLASPSSDNPTKVERDLLKVFPENLWGGINHRLVLFGREYCNARNPRCLECPMADLCPSRQVIS
jgi:endonuclease-3